MDPWSIFTDAHLDWYKMTPGQAEEAGMTMPRGRAVHIGIYQIGDKSMVLEGWQYKSQLIMRWDGEFWTADTTPLLRAFLEQLGVEDEPNPGVQEQWELQDLNKRIAQNTGDVKIEAVALTSGAGYDAPPKVTLTGPGAKRPASGRPGRFYHSEEGDILYEDNGKEWVVVEQ